MEIIDDNNFEHTLKQFRIAMRDGTLSRRSIFWLIDTVESQKGQINALFSANRHLEKINVLIENENENFKKELKAKIDACF